MELLYLFYFVNYLKIEKMAVLFGVSPEYIMAFDEKEKSEYLTEDMVKKYLITLIII